MERTNRHVDPLQPEYHLPSFKAATNTLDFPSLSKARDIMNVSDIPGAKPNSLGQLKNRSSRDALYVADIDGAQADYHGFHSTRARFEISLNKSPNFAGNAQPKGMKQEDYQPLTFESAPKFYERTNRRTDPVQPVYEVHGLTVTDDARSKPKKPRAYVAAGTFSLTTQDILGATSTNSPSKRERREIRDIMNTMDVLGAQADTVVHSIVSDRVTCPLFPVYQSLDDGSPMQAVIKPLLTASEVKHPSIRLLKMHTEELAKRGSNSYGSSSSGNNAPPASVNDGLAGSGGVSGMDSGRGREPHQLTINASSQSRAVLLIDVRVRGS